MIEIDNLHKHYRAPGGGEVAVLKGITLRVPAGSITAVVGPSGAGKSTLAKCISLLEKPDSGSIRVNGNDLSLLSGEALRRERRAIGTVFQSSALLQRKTAWQNIALPLEYLGVVPRDINKRVATLLEAVGLAHKADFYPTQLSGGQRQRIGIARALALQPSVLLADEATSGLDPDATATVLQLLKQLRDEFGLSIILITHEMDAVRRAADAVAEIRDGQIIQQGGVAELLAQPDSLLGQQLFPVNSLPSHSALQLRITYSTSKPVSTDWISRLSLAHNLHIELLGGHVERLDRALAGRLQVAVRFNDRPTPTAQLLQHLQQLGIHADVIEQPPQLREAV
ncbi:Methionine ABC transporter ATP-binding protein [Paramixta manurensis]|uniref:Methionine ABC transporter ATP-binding protein n=1 Tax=Paramixta manurensis TaxID=2740817 RepID=A0A6M8UJX5_9GAMM|nr:Methionine ABC transporter ATP-binding protein [Erwiniaceae bacterium PD-1]